MVLFLVATCVISSTEFHPMVGLLIVGLVGISQYYAHLEENEGNGEHVCFYEGISQTEMETDTRIVFLLRLKSAELLVLV